MTIGVIIAEDLNGKLSVVGDPAPVSELKKVLADYDGSDRGGIIRLTLISTRGVEKRKKILPQEASQDPDEKESSKTKKKK